jgi:hypothetical protein
MKSSPQTKYSQMVIDAQLAHLESLRTKIADMVLAKIEKPKDIVVVGAAGLTVGDWVEVMHDLCHPDGILSILTNL